MQKKSDSISFQTEDGEEVRFFVLEETMLAGDNYLLVTDGTGEESEEAYILQEMQEEGEDKVYEMVDDKKKLEALSKVFSELLENVDFRF